MLYPEVDSMAWDSDFAGFWLKTAGTPVGMVLTLSLTVENVCSDT